jgi:uncharacterized cupin superfamily protein
MPPEPKHHYTAAEIAAMRETPVAHPLNPQSEVHMRALSQEAGLQRCGLTLGRIPPGKESFAYHTHQREEEFAYILSGRGRAEIDGTWVELGPGDFLAFPAPSVGHQITNPYDADLVYLMGGERSEVEVAEFPRHGKRIFRLAGDNWIVDEGNARKLRPRDYLLRRSG